MADVTEMIQSLRPVVTELERLGVRYCIGGSVASSLHGASRSTMDVDLAAELDETTALRLTETLREDFYVSETAALEAVRRHSCFNLLHFATSFKIDIFISGGREFDRQVQDRAIVDTLGETDSLPVRVVSAEDIVLLKLEWYRLGDAVSERQWDDVTRVVKLNDACLDRDYLRRWAGELGVSDLLERVLGEGGNEGEC